LQPSCIYFSIGGAIVQQAPSIAFSQESVAALTIFNEGLGITWENHYIA
jgi:hypothetical protein